MSFDWDSYLSLANDLKTRTKGQEHSNTIEAMQRSALSRAYYSMFHLAEDFAKAKLGYLPQKDGPNQSHSDIQGVYRRQFGNPNHQEVKKILYRMYKARLDSDYNSNSLGNVQELLDSILLDADRIKVILR